MFQRFIGVHRSVLLCIVSFIFQGVAVADTANFIQQRDLGPIKVQTGLPEAASRFDGVSQLQIGVVHNNVFMGGSNDNEQLILDGESSQLNIRYRRRLNPCWQLNVSGVYLSHSSGFFDKPLDAWHQFFGLPDAKRDEWPDNLLLYAYRNEAGESSLTQSTHGIGDVQLQAQYYAGCDTNRSVIRAGLKLPLGDIDDFNSAGTIDAFVDVQSPWWQSTRFPNLQWAGSIGLLGRGDSDLAIEHKPLAGFGTVGLNYSINSKTQLITQLDWHTSLFESSLRELSATGVQLTIGARYHSRPNGFWEFSFSEDAAVDTVPDIVVRLAWTRSFGG